MLITDIFSRRFTQALQYGKKSLVTQMDVGICWKNLKYQNKY